MKDAKSIINEVKTISIPNSGVKALAKEAWDDPDFCIMDDEYCRQTYRQECPDRGICHKSSFMLACLATRMNYQLGDIAIKIYNNSNK